MPGGVDDALGRQYAACRSQVRYKFSRNRTAGNWIVAHNLLFHWEFCLPNW
jgi:hypothetical protein